MQSGQKTTFSIMFTSIFLMLTLAFLTVSLPFVYKAKQIAEMEASAASINIGEAEEECDNPFANTTEEKPTSNISSASEEYLHDNHKSEHYFSIISQFHKSESATDYIAFHGELLVPPPNLA